MKSPLFALAAALLLALPLWWRTAQSIEAEPRLGVATPGHQILAAERAAGFLVSNLKKTH